MQEHAGDEKFESLTLALEGLFDKEWEELPEALQQRVKVDFFPLTWGMLAPDQRHELALQRDYQNDPATRPEREYWYNHFARIRELKEELAKWEAIDTPTATDLAKKETRCKELRQKIERLEAERDKPASTATQDQRTRPAANQQPAKSGRRKSQLRLGVEAFWQIKLREGQIDILQPGAIDIFMSQLRREFNNYDEIAEHIVNIKTVGGVMRVYVQDPPDDDPKVKKKNEKPDGCTKTAVSKILSDLRKKFPLE
ncbi:MAG: hypothetical protein GX087_05745 [Desulfobulbaceae bacterium]|nr:hypothetical protein [Desulfobulbaceae bacterium]